MTMYVSMSTRGFYDSNIHTHMPSDCKEIGDDRYLELLSAQSAGLVIDWSGEVPVAIEPPSPSLEDLREYRVADIAACAATGLAALSAAYPSGEVQSWAQQAREAEALAIDPSASAPLLAAISAARGVPLYTLAARVRAKVQAYAVASGRIIGQRQALEDAINAVDLSAPDAAERLEAIQWPA